MKLQQEPVDLALNKGNTACLRLSKTNKIHQAAPLQLTTEYTILQLLDYDKSHDHYYFGEKKKRL